MTTTERTALRCDHAGGIDRMRRWRLQAPAFVLIACSFRCLTELLKAAARTRPPGEGGDGGE
jgi:hypothetical protein